MLVALGVAAVDAYQTSLLINEVFAGAIAAFLAGFITGTVRNITLERPLNSIFPGIDGLAVEF